MTPKFAAKLGLATRSNGYNSTKIDSSALKSHNGLRNAFFDLNSMDIEFDTKSFTWRSYTTAKALPTAKWIERIDKQKFAKAALDKNSETFVIYIAAFDIFKPAMPIPLFWAGQVVENNFA